VLARSLLRGVNLQPCAFGVNAPLYLLFDRFSRAESKW
jgi:hypothetical protein